MSEPLTIDDVIALAASSAKPNFTQLQLKLAELQAEPKHYEHLRIVMEKKFNLEPLEK